MNLTLHDGRSKNPFRSVPFLLVTANVAACSGMVSEPSPSIDESTAKACRSSYAGGDVDDAENGSCVTTDDSVYALAGAGNEMPCGTRNRPCRRLQAAADQLSIERPRLVLFPSTAVFEQGAKLQDIGAPIHVLGNDVHVSTAGGSAFVVAGGQVTFDRIFAENATDALAAGIECEGGSVVVRDSTLRTSRHGIRADNCNVEVERTTLAYNDVGIRALSEQGVLDVSRCWVEGNAQAIYTDADPLRLQNNLFLRNGDDGYTRVIELVNRTGTPFFGYNTLVGNFNNCIYVGIVACNGEGTATLTSNISWGNFPNWDGIGDDCLGQVFNCPGSTVSNTIAERALPGVDNSIEDPLFVDATGDDYHLTANSPAIDPRTSPFAPSSDYYGNKRARFAPADIGAVEFAR